MPGEGWGLRDTALPRALLKLLTLGAVALMVLGASTPSFAGDVEVATVQPAQITPQLLAERMQPAGGLRPGYTQPVLTNDLLAAYVQREGGEGYPPFLALQPQLVVRGFDELEQRLAALPAGGE